jgi:cellulose synthase/poly-beta-1,6-N-acetylglucosamine synthase-like glycosyltransferase
MSALCEFTQAVNRLHARDNYDNRHGRATTMWATESFHLAPWINDVAAFSSGFTLASVALISMTALGKFKIRWANRHEAVQIVLTALGGMLIALPFADLLNLLCITGGVVLICWVLRVMLPVFSVAGVCYSVQAPLLLGAGVYWYYIFISGLDLERWQIVMVLVPLFFNAVELLLDYVVCMITYTLFIRKTWREPHSAYYLQPDHDGVFVSVHVPCHAEPPELVIGTLTSLAELEYFNYEVIVCDNNTTDPRLWQPVEAYCETLNQELGLNRFRFFHVESLQGAKSGALNFCLDRTSEKATLIAVVDADYMACPDFLSVLVPMFKDPQLDFVQTSHDYRDGGKSLYNRICYWEYLLFTKFGMAGLNELGAAFTIGTMCVLRKRAVHEAGRWDEWCLTEDCEIAVRLRARGGKGHYFSETFGRGTMPETFAHWKQQRFRWTAGPTQQLVAHWRLFLPRMLGGSPALSASSKVFEILRGVQILPGICALLAVVAAAIAFILVAPEEPPRDREGIPALAFFITFALTTAPQVLTGASLYVAGCRSVLLMFAAVGAGTSATCVRMIATAAVLLGLPLAWKRTPKFKTHASLVQALMAALPELLLALLMVILLVLLIGQGSETGWGVVFVIGAGLVRFMLTFMAAPVLALISVQRLRAVEGAGAE